MTKNYTLIDPEIKTFCVSLTVSKMTPQGLARTNLLSYWFTKTKEEAIGKAILEAGNDRPGYAIELTISLEVDLSKILIEV